MQHVQAATHVILTVAMATLQLLMCRRGEDIVLVTLNHLDTVRKLVGDSDIHIGLIDNAIKILTDVSTMLFPAHQSYKHCFSFIVGSLHQSSSY